jgi:hypothetical protein
MKNLSLVLVVICSAGFFSCDKGEPGAAVVVDLSIDLNLENAAGQDLLNPATLNAIQEDDITVYYDIDGEKKTCAEVNAANNDRLDYPNGFLISAPAMGTGQYTLRLFSNSFVSNATTTTINIEDREEIELVTKVTRNEGNILIEEIWYKEDMVWSKNSAVPKHLTIVLE